MGPIGRKREHGQAIVEYSLLLVLLVLVSIVILSVTGVDVQVAMCQVVKMFNSTNQCGHYFIDDFANLSNWKIVNGTWQAVNGLINGGPLEGRIFHDLSQSDYVINLKDATLVQGSGYGIFFRATNTAMVNGYTFQYDPGYGGFIMRKWVNGNQTAPFAAASAPGYNWTQPNRQVQVVVKGNTFIAYVDGTKVLQGTDSTFTSGGIGLRTWNGTMKVDGISVDPAP